MQTLTPYLHYKDQQLWMENVSIQQLALHLTPQIEQQISQPIDTPFYCYSNAALQDNITACKAAFSPHNINIHYAMKANSNLSILRIIAEQGLGVDIVSIGEMQRALKAGFAPQDIVFSGVGKTAKELEAALLAGVGQFNLESKEELHALEQTAIRCACTVSALIRVNPEVAVDTHKNITTGAKGNKFGVSFSDVLPMLNSAQQAGAVRIQGIAMHIGSQIHSTQPYLDAIDKVTTLISDITDKGHTLKQLDLGGGFGVNYAVNYAVNYVVKKEVKNEPSQSPSFADFAVAIKQALPNWQGNISVEPGRSLVANIGVMVSQVTYVKQSKPTPFLILDAAMNDLMRPALYQATHSLIPVQEKPDQPQCQYDVVGPVCESTDTFEKSALLPHDLTQGELMCFLYTGAYCAVMSNSYNSRPIIAEVLIENDSASVIRRPISQTALMAFEEPLK
jgi:diaminopimelate decarboxylase